MSSMDEMANLLDRIGAELDAMAGRLSRVGVAGNGTAGPVEGADLQDIDLAEQTLRCLATVLRTTARQEAAAGRVDLDRIADGLPLDAVAGVVRGAAPGAAQDGDLDLF